MSRLVSIIHGFGVVKDSPELNVELEPLSAMATAVGAGHVPVIRCPKAAESKLSFVSPNS